MQDERRWSLAFVTIVGVALVLRLWNLGTFSLWLDEIVTLRFAALPFDKHLSACAGDAENVPLYAVVAFLASRAGLDEPWIRIPYILFGTVGVAVLMLWVRGRLGMTPAIAAGVFAALSPFHVRYSQEMRGYSILLLLIPLCLLVTERLARSPGWRPAAILGVLVAVGGYTHLTFWIVIPTLLAISLSNSRVSDQGLRSFRLTISAVAAGVLAFVPWIIVIWQTLGTRMARGGTDWTVTEVGIRWHALTGAAREGLVPTPSSAVLALFFLIGLGVLMRDRRHRLVVGAVLGAWLAWEGILAAIGHWSDARYVLALWFLIPFSFGAAIQRVTDIFNNRWIHAAAYCLLAACLFPGTWRYWHEGRPHWDTLADIVNASARHGEPVVAANEWSRVCLSWYLPGRLFVQPADVTDLGEPSVLVVSGGLAPSKKVDAPPDTARTTIARVRQTGRLERLVQLPVQGKDSPTWWLPYTSLLPSSVVTIPQPAPERWLKSTLVPAPAPASVMKVDFREPLPLRKAGFGPARSRPNGTGFAWVIGNEAALQLPSFSGSVIDVGVTLRPFRGVANQQWIRLLIGDQVAIEKRMAPGTQTISLTDFPVPDELEGPVFVLQFSASGRPSDFNSESSDSRHLAAAIENITVTARP